MITGAVRPNQPARSSAAAGAGASPSGSSRPYSDQLSPQACSWPSVIRPPRCTKLTTRRPPGTRSSSSSLDVPHDGASDTPGTIRRSPCGPSEPVRDRAVTGIRVLLRIRGAPGRARVGTMSTTPSDAERVARLAAELAELGRRMAWARYELLALSVAAPVPMPAGPEPAPPAPHPAWPQPALELAEFEPAAPGPA